MPPSPTLSPGRGGGIALCASAATFVLASVSQAGWQSLRYEDGLASNHANCALQDRSGVLWVGTSQGLARYDGVRWQTITSAAGLPCPPASAPCDDRFDYVTALCEDHAGELWVGTVNGGAARFDGATWTPFTTVDGLAMNDVNSIAEDHAQQMWFATGQGASRLSGTTWRTFTTADGLANNTAECVFVDRAGRVWIGTDGGVSQYDGARWTTFTTANGLANNLVWSIAEARDGAMWFGTPGGVSRFDGVTWKTYTTANGVTQNRVRSVVVDRDGFVWCGTDSGASRFDGTRWRPFKTADGLVGEQVLGMYAGAQGDLWFATGDGVSRYDGSDWKTFTTADGLASFIIREMRFDRAGDLWVSYAAYPPAGVSRFDGRTWRTFTTADGLPSNSAGGMVDDRTGRTWMLSGNSLVRYDGSSWTPPPSWPSAFGTRPIGALFADRDGNIWVAVSGRGLGRYDGTAWTVLAATSLTALGAVSAIYQDRSGVFWFHSATYDSLIRYDGSTATTFPGPGGSFQAGQAYGGHGILDDRDGHLWMRTDLGLHRFDGAGWRLFAPSNGLAGLPVHDMIEDREGNLWVSTPAGLGRYDGSNWRTFTSADGLGSDEVLGLLQDRQGTLWCGTQNGLSRYLSGAWKTYTSARSASLYAVALREILEDPTGSLWMDVSLCSGFPCGIVRHDPDRVAPRAVLTSRPPAV